MVREVLAGASTFITMAYLFILYPSLLSEAGFPFEAAFNATILVSIASTLAVGLYARFPVAVAPGLAVGAYLVYSVILDGNTPKDGALGMVFWVGFALFFLSLCKARQKIIHTMPVTIRNAAIGGMGLFLICIAAKDLGLINKGSQGIFAFHTFGTIEQGVAAFGLAIFWILHFFQSRFAFIASVACSFALSIGLGLTHIDKWIDLPSLQHLFLTTPNLTFPLQTNCMEALLTMLLIALFDTSASLIALGQYGGHMNQQGQVQGIDKIVLVDSVGSMTGSFFGTGTVTFLLESIAGLKAGGRGPWTAITIAALSTGSLFLYPLLATIPHYATSFLLVAIGGFMLGACRQIPWRKWSDALPAAAILITIPLTFSIYKGLAAGFVLFVLCKTMAQEKDALHPLVIGLSTLFIFHYFIF